MSYGPQKWCRRGMPSAAQMLVVAAGCVSCSSVGREVIYVPGPDGRDRAVSKPADDVLNSDIGLNIKAKLPEVADELLEAEAGFSQAFTRVRSEIPSLIALEVLDYQLSLARARGDITPEQYAAFVEKFYPKLLERVSARASSTTPETGEGIR